MRYYEIELDEFFRVTECPRCQNEKVTGDYCQVCGTYLINKCSGFEPENINDPYTGKWHELEKSCGELLEGDARFSVRCGSTSVFYENGLLEHWEQE